MNGNQPNSMKRLIEDARTGSVPALDQLLQHLYPKFLRLAKYAVRSDEAAKDVVQETLIRLSQNLSTLRDPNAFNGWANAILTRCCISHFREEKRLRLFAGDYENLAELACVSDWEGPDYNAQRDLIEVIDLLGSKSQEVVRMHYFVGLSIKEIAVTVRVSAGAVKVRLHRARAELRNLLNVQENSAGAIGWTS